MIWLSKVDHGEQISWFHLGMFKKISVNVLTCQLGSVLILRCWNQVKLIMLLFIAAVLALLKCPISLSKGGGGGILKLILQWVIWWWQYESKEARVLQSRIILGWSVITRSIYVGFLLGSKFVGSEIIWDRPIEVQRFSISIPSGDVSPSGHQN